MPTAVDMAVTRSIRPGGGPAAAGRGGIRHAPAVAAAGWPWLRRRCRPGGPTAAVRARPASDAFRSAEPRPARARGAGGCRVLACIGRSVATCHARTAARRSPARRATSTTCGCRACCSARRCARPSRMARITARRVPRLPGLVGRRLPRRPRRATSSRSSTTTSRAWPKTRCGTWPSRCCCWPTPTATRLADAVGRRRHRLRAAAADRRSARLDALVQGHRHRQGRPRPRPGRRGADRRGRIPHRASGAALHRDQRGHRRAVARAADRAAGRGGRRA